MTGMADLPRPFFQRLGFRLAVAFGLALLPFGIVSSLQSRSLQKEAQARSEAALLGQTMLAIAPEANLMRSAWTTTAALAIGQRYSLVADDADCSLIMQRVIEAAEGRYSFAAFVPASGLATCTSNGKVLDLTQSERVRANRADPRPDAVVIVNGAASGTSVLAFGHPVFDLEGGYLGYISVSVPHAVLTSFAASTVPGQMTRQPIALMTFDKAGNILASSTGLTDAPLALPGDRPLVDLAVERAWTFRAVSKNGDSRIYTVFPVIENTIFAIGSWSGVASAGPLGLRISPYLFPVLMWLVSLLVAVLAAERLITRHIRVLRTSIIAFASGNHRVRDIDIPNAAVEIRDVTESYLKLADTILRDEAELEDIIHQREVLLREVHHRVKNNLQLIASIMNMQARQSTSVEARTLLKSVQDRVMSLATIHRGLYQTSGLTDVRADELLSDILRQVLKISTGPGRRFNVVSQFDDLHLTPDQAVPLSLLLTEALTNAIKYAGTRDSGSPLLEVSLRRDGHGKAKLTVRNEVRAIRNPAETLNGTGLGTQLLAAFAQQLGAKLSTGIEGGLYKLQVEFGIRALSEAEHGNATDQGEDVMDAPAQIASGDP